MKQLVIALALFCTTPALAQTPDAPAPKYSIQSSTLGQLVENPQTKALLVKYFPEVANHPQLNEGLGLTLPDVVQYLPDVITPEKLAAMDAELKVIP
ncbi:MAG: hypothetical protein U1E93_09530 [Alphaproteobacteria bacterium]